MAAISELRPGRRSACLSSALFDDDAHGGAAGGVDGGDAAFEPVGGGFDFAFVEEESAEVDGGLRVVGSDREGFAKAALEREEVDLVLFGQQASDADGAVLWAAVAERLGRPVVSQAMELAVDGDSVRVKRQTEFGYDTLEAPLPAVVAVSDAINEPRYPSLKGIMGAKKKPQDVLSLAELEVDAGEVGEAGSRTTVLALGNPPSRGDAQKIEDDGNAAQAIVDFLAEKRLV